MTAATVATLSIMLGCQRSPRTERPQAGVMVEAATFKALTNQSQAYPRVIWELSAALYDSDRQKGTNPILTTHRGSGLLKYTDGTATVVSLPTRDAQDEIGIGLFALQYNTMNIQRADDLVLGGKVQEARRLYSLIKHFDVTGNLAIEIDQKLSILDQIQSGSDQDLALSKFKELCSQFFSILSLTEMASLRPRVVTNLLALSLNATNTSQSGTSP